jgi:hypothetical protein
LSVIAAVDEAGSAGSARVADRTVPPCLQFGRPCAIAAQILS